MMNRCRFAHLTLSTVVVGAVALAPVADVQASPLGMKLRRVMTLQPEGEGEAAAAPEAAPAEGAAAAPEGPAPAPAAAPAGPPPSKGLGMMISGAVITGVYALPLIGYGAFIVAAGRKVEEEVGTGGLAQTGGNILGGTLLVMGIIGLGVGVPLLGVGAARFSKYQKWKAGQQAMFLPSAGRTVFGTITPGVEIRF